MNKDTSLIQGYKNWYNNSEDGKDILSLEMALWSVLCEPNLLSSNKIVFYQVYALIQMFLHKRPSQHSMLKNLAYKEGYNTEDTHICLIGRLIMKLTPNLKKLEEKKNQLKSEEDFGKYLFKTGEIVTMHCVEEFINDIVSNKIESIMIEQYYGNYNISKYQDLSYIQYEIVTRHQAILLAEIIKEEWKIREINVLCHDLDNNCESGSNRLKNESRDNIYKLHERIRTKLKLTLENNNFDENVGRLFIKEFLKKICQNCPPLPTYKEEKGY